MKKETPGENIKYYYEEVDLLTFDGENGEEENFVIVADLKIEDKSYVVLCPLELYEPESGIIRTIIMGTEKNENGENLYFDIEDPEEWQMVATSAELLYTTPNMLN
ncbi:MAG: DUF1292 domain-containing protein [Ignavibacteriales bacterium]